MSPASSAGAGSRRVTIRSMSCRGIKAFVPFQKPPLYAAVSLGGRREKTPADTDGGENPDWEGEVFAFDLDGDVQQQLMQFEVKAQVPLLGHKLVGTASVPLADLAAGGGGAGDGAALRHASYQVCAPDGKPNGTFSFAYAISSGAGGPHLQPQLHTVPDGAPPEQGPTFFSPPPPVTAYPASSTANFTPHGGSYPPPPQPSPPVSGSFYPTLHDLLPSSTYPPPPSTRPHPTMTNPHFSGPNSSCYPPPPAPDSIYSAPPAPDPIYPPPPAPDSVYPPPPPESGSAYHLLPRSAPSPSSSTMDRELSHYQAPSSTYPSPPGGSYYPPPELDGAARTPYYYPPPGSRYP